MCQLQAQQAEEAQVGEDAFEQLKQLAAKAAVELEPQARCKKPRVTSQLDETVSFITRGDV